jgi:hypothetical protein
MISSFLCLCFRSPLWRVGVAWFVSFVSLAIFSYYRCIVPWLFNPRSLQVCSCSCFFVYNHHWCCLVGHLDGSQVWVAGLLSNTFLLFVFLFVCSHLCLCLPFRCNPPRCLRYAAVVNGLCFCNHPHHCFRDFSSHYSCGSVG